MYTSLIDDCHRTPTRYTTSIVLSIQWPPSTVDSMKETLGELVQRRRAELGLTQQRLADLAGLKKHAIGGIEAGQSKLPVPETRRKLAAALRLTHEALLIAAGELLPEEASRISEPVRFVEGTVQADAMAMIETMTEDEVRALLDAGKVLIRLSRGINDLSERPPVTTIEHHDTP